MFVLALAGKCCCDRAEAELPTNCVYLKNGNNCAKTHERLPHKVRPNDRSTSKADCEALVRQNAAAKDLKRDRELHAHATAIRESQAAFRADQALEAAKHNTNKDWKGTPEVTKFYNELEKMGYEKDDILYALVRNQYTSVQGAVRILEHEGIQPDPTKAEQHRQSTQIRVTQMNLDPEQDAYRPGNAEDTAARHVDTPFGLPALPAEWKHIPNPGGQEYWQYEGSQTWSYHKPVVIGGGWICIVEPADEVVGKDETPYYWNLETGTTQYEKPEEAVTSFGLDCPKLTKSQPTRTYEEPVSHAFAHHTYAEIDQVRREAFPGAGYVEIAADAAAAKREEPRVARRHVPVGANGF